MTDKDRHQSADPAVQERIQTPPERGAMGVFINPVKYPAVAKHKSRFRMSISAAHTHDDLLLGADRIAAVPRDYGVIR